MILIQQYGNTKKNSEPNKTLQNSGTDISDKRINPNDADIFRKGALNFFLLYSLI